MNNDDIYKKAKKRVKAKKGFFYHFFAYALVLAMLSTIMYFENNQEFLPVIIVGLSWGIGLASHYFGVFGTEHLGFLGVNSNWEEEELEKEVERLTRKKELKERIKSEEDYMEDPDFLELKEVERKPLDDGFELR